MNVITKGTGCVSGLVAVMDKPQCQLGVPTMLRGKLLDQVRNLLPPRSLTFHARIVPLPLWAPCLIEFSD